MAEHSVELVIRRASRDDPLEHLIDAVLARARSVRGGEALLEQLWGPEISPTALHEAIRATVDQGVLWIAERDGGVVAAALVRDRCVQAIWVEPAYRRRHIATILLDALLDAQDFPVDAWALPGDRATKSLYESVGWKARLLTMRGV